MSKTVRGNIDPEQIQGGCRQGDSNVIQMFGGGSVVKDAPLLYDADGNAISGAVAQLVPTSPGDGTKFLSGTTPPSWATPSGGGGGGGGSAWTLLGTQTAINSSTLNFTSWRNDSLYDDYVIWVSHLIPSVNGAKIGIRMSTNAGSSYDSSAIYWWQAYAIASSGSGGNGVTGATNTQSNFSNSQANVSPLNGQARLYMPSSASVNKYLDGQFVGLTSSGQRLCWVYSGSYESTAAVDAFQILPDSGNLTSGAVRLYGIDK